MRILAAIFPDAWDISFDITGIQIRLIERRIEQLNQRGISAHQARIDCPHRHARALGVTRAGEHGPALRNRIDLAFRIARRA